MMVKKIEVLDSIMGSGKTQGIVKWMKNNPSNKYLYVSPLLDEVEQRIPLSCGVLDFVHPTTEEYPTKGEHLLELLKQGCNIAFTHSLFESLSKQHLQYIEQHKYVLIIDEEIDFIEPYQGNDYSSEDIITLEKSGHIKVDEDNLGRVLWTWDNKSFLGGSYH